MIYEHTTNYSTRTYCHVEFLFKLFDKGPFVNYVSIFLPIFDQVSTLSSLCLSISMFTKWGYLLKHFADQLRTPKCLRNLQTAPK